MSFWSLCLVPWPWVWRDVRVVCERQNLRCGWQVCHHGERHQSMVCDWTGQMSSQNPLAPKDLFKIKQFSGNFKGKPLILSKFWCQGPLTKILDPPLESVLSAKARTKEFRPQNNAIHQKNWSVFVRIASRFSQASVKTDDLQGHFLGGAVVCFVSNRRRATSWFLLIPFQKCQS